MGAHLSGTKLSFCATDALEQKNASVFKSGSVYTDTGLSELEVQFVGIGKFAAAKKMFSSLTCIKR